MPKVIQPRRHDKSLSAEQFWEIRNQQKAPLAPMPAPVYREEEIASRYRFKKPSELAKTFNPLGYFYRTHRTHFDNQLHRMVEEDEDTYIGKYLTNNQGQVSPALAEIKRWASGRSNILHNQLKILSLLISNLQVEDSWPLLQALLKDCRGAHIDAWINFALQQIAETISSLTGTTFNQTLFSHLFDTLCILMQTSFNSIADSLEPFFASFATAFLKHSNKYIRQFSLQAFSYILSNLPEEGYKNFLDTLNKLQSQGFFDSLLSLVSLLVQRLIFSKGCMTAASLGIFLAQLESFKDTLSASSAQSPSGVVRDYIFLVLKQLNTKGGGNSESILFDLNYVLSALLKLAAGNPDQYRPPLMGALSKFVSLYQAEPKRFQPNTAREESFLKMTWSILSGFYQESTDYFSACEQLDVALAVMSTKGEDCLLYNKSIINYYKNHPEAVSVLIKFLHDRQIDLKNSLTQIVLLLSKDILTQFFQRSNNQSQIATLYSLAILLKRSSFPHLIQSSYLQLTPPIIQAKIKNCQSRDELFLVLRLLTYIKCESTNQLFVFLLEVRDSTLAEYDNFFSSLSQQSKVSEWIAGNPMPSQFYEWRRFAEQIVVYSHHQIPWMREAFNFLEAFNLLFQHLHNTQGMPLPQSSSTWNHLLVNRPSAIRILGNTLQERQDLTLPFISSRNREVRLLALKIFKSKFFEEDTQQAAETMSEAQKLSLIVRLLLQIDQEQITLENQREVKRSFCQLEEAINSFEGQPSFRKISVFQHTLHWSLGFAFTGFKLIHQAFISFFSKLIGYHLVSNPGLSVVAGGLLPFLCYYNYRHSRQHDFDVAEDSSHLTNLFQPTFSSRMLELVQQDLEIKDLQTVEWIGLQRIAEAIKSSPQAKQNLSSYLLSLVSSYFSVQFTRQQRLIKQSQLSPQSPLLLPIKSRFLGTLLKLCPREFMPPAECLHFVRDEYLDVGRVREIKKHGWESVWQKGKEGGKGDKNQRTKTSVNLSHLSPTEQELYLHYLWKELLEVNHHKKRSILEHIRNQLNGVAPRIIQILFASLYLDDLSQSPDSVSIAARRLQLINRKVLLTHMFILKSILTHLRNLITHNNTLQMVLMFILALIQVAYSSSSKEASLLPDMSPEKDSSEVEQVISEQEAQNQEQSQSHLYKQHRKQLQKLLETLFANHTLPTETVSQLIGFLLQKTRINLCKATRSSVPGLLHILLVLSQQKQYCEVLLKVSEGRIVSMLAEMMGRDSSGAAPLSACQSIWLRIFENIMLSHSEQTQSEVSRRQQQLRINGLMQRHATILVASILNTLTIPALQTLQKNKKQSSNNEQTRLLTVADRLMQLSGCVLGQGWNSYLWKELSAVAKTKGRMGSWQHQKLSLLLRIIGRYLQSQPGMQGQFLQKIVLLLPYLKDLQHREQIIQIITKNHLQLGLRQSVVQLVLKMGSLKRVGLEITLNFNSFFQASSEYASLAGSFSGVEHEYFLHHLLSFTDHQELPLRKAVHQSLKVFLQQTASRLNTSLLTEGKLCSEIAVKLFRVLLDFIQKVQVQQNQSVFWSIVDDLEIIFSWLAKNAALLRPLLSDCLDFYAWLAATKDETDYLRLLVSISESNKLKALKQLKTLIQNLSEEQCRAIREWKQGPFDLPNPLHRLILPVLLYFISRPHAKQDQQSKSNLSSSLALNSLELLPLVSSILKPSSLRSELKRLVSKLKFSEAHSKSNLSTIKIIGQLLEGVPGETATTQLHSFIHQHGFEQFHQRLVQHHQVPSEPEEQEEQEDQILAKPKVPDYYDHLEELEEEQAIRRNFLSFDKKLMQFEEEEPEQDEFCAFLKRHILPPLRTLLMVQSRGKEEEDTSRAKILLSVTTIKVILRLPLETFLREFQKVIAKLSRLLKKRDSEVRQYARRCLCEITKTVGPQLLYSVVTTLQFHLKDNFDRHVFNYTVYRILEGLLIKPGDIDYCLPLLLPMVMDEVYGRTSSQKQMVARAEAPTLKTEAKKKKGLQLLQLLFKYLSHAQVNFVIDFLQKYLCQHLISEENMGKYDQILGSLSSGLAANQDVMDPAHSSTLLQALSSPVSSLRQHLKWLSQQGNAGHERLAGRQWGRKKVGKEQTLTLQEEAGRNRSIFARLSNEIAEKKNNQIVTSALVQFYLTVMSLLVRKQVLTLNSAVSESQAEQLMTLIAFLVDCIDHRDNRLVSKSLKILHFTLSWKTDSSPSFVADRIKSLRKQANRKVLGLAERLTLSDEELLKECFVFLNDLIGEAAVSVQMLPSLVALIKLHTPTTEDQPHLAQTYKLLRTIVYKSSLYIYNPLLQDLQKMVKLQLATSSNRQIRQISKNILSVYLKEKAALVPDIEAFNLEAKRHGWPSISYDTQVKEELRFYLSNLEGSGQSAIIQLLTEWAQHRSKQELEEYSELLILSAMTARTNQLAQQAELNSQFLSESHLTDSLIQNILDRMDQSKLNGFIDKIILWMQSPRSTSVQLCGSSLLTLILAQLSKTQRVSKINQSQLVGPKGCLSSIAIVLSQEVNAYEQYSAFEKTHARMDAKWNEIIQKIQKESIPYQCDLSVFQALRQLRILSEIQSIKKQIDSSILSSVWRLLRHSNPQIVQEALKVSQSHNILLVVNRLQKAELSMPSEYYSPKQVINKLLFSTVPSEQIQALVLSLLQQELTVQESKVLKSVSQLLIGLSLKSHIKPKVFQSTLPKILSLLNNVLLSSDVGGSSIRSILCRDDHSSSKLVELTLKLISNELINYESKAMVQATSEILKQELGNEKYFKLVSAFEEGRQERRTQEKIRKAEMTMLDPEGLAGERKMKKRKLQ